MVGFDDVPVVSSVVPGCTTVRQSMEALRREMVRTILDVVAGEPARSSVCSAPSWSLAPRHEGRGQAPGRGRVVQASGPATRAWTWGGSEPATRSARETCSRTPRMVTRSAIQVSRSSSAAPV